MEHETDEAYETPERTHLHQESGQSQEDTVSAGWRPSYLRRRVLISFLIGYCAIFVALEVLSHYSQKNHGIASSTERLHYGWTYGPTAILTVVIALWSRTEFQIKQNAPWQAMLQNPQQSDKSLLLDYVSTMQPLAMWTAFKKKHFVVTIAIASSLILRLVIILSTGLLSLQQVLVVRDGVPVQILNSFNVHNDSSNTFAVGDEPYDVLYAVAFENMSYAGGTNANFTFQQFSMPDNLTNALLTVNVTGLSADLDCERANVSSINANDAGEVQLSSPSCLMSDVSLLEQDMGGSNNFSQVRFFTGNCTNSSGIDGMRILVTATEMLMGNITLGRSRQWLCQPTFSSVGLQVQVNTTEGLTSAQVQQVRIDSMLSSEMAWNVANEALYYTQLSGDMALPNYRVGNDSIDLGVGIGMYLAGFDQDTEVLFEDDGLLTAASTYYRAVTAELTNVALSQRNESTTIRGNAAFYENRVVITQGALRAMEAFLVVLLVLNITLLALDCHRETAPWSPHQLSPVAAVLANSDSLRELLHGTGGATWDVLDSCLAGRKYETRHTPRGFAIAVTEGNHEESEFVYEATTQAWNPFPNLKLRVCIFGIVAITIAALEIVLHTSQAHDGMGDVPNNSHIHYAWTIFPALIMNMIAIPFASINFNTKCIAPYSQLLNKGTGSTFQQSMNLDFMDALDITNVFRSIQLRRLSILSTTLATIIASTLTIVTSGLFSAIQMPQVTPIIFAQESGFNPDYISASVGVSALQNDPSEDLETAGYILRNNLSFPQWTYEGLVFPELSYQGNSTKYERGSFVDIELPALRAGISCNLRSMNEIPLNYTRENLYVGIYEPPCTRDGTAKNLTHDLEVPPQSYFGHAQPWSCSDEESLTGAETINSTFIWGFVDSDSVAYAAELVCSSSTEAVQTQVRFSLPSLEITLDHLPVTNDSSVVKLSSFKSSPSTWGSLSTTSGLPGDLDGFFQILVYGKYAFPLDYLGSSNHTEVVTSAIMEQYQSMQAQLMNTESRSSNNVSVLLPGQDQSGGFIGNVTDLNRLRLVQDAVSTRTLQALLACMLLLGIIGSMSTNTDRVLPKNPCSIAAVASLLADSNFLDRYQHESTARDPNDSSFGKDVFLNTRFFMGWISNGHIGAPGAPRKALTADTDANETSKLAIYVVDNPT